MHAYSLHDAVICGSLSWIFWFESCSQCMAQYCVTAHPGSSRSEPLIQVHPGVTPSSCVLRDSLSGPSRSDLPSRSIPVYPLIAYTTWQPIPVHPGLSHSSRYIPVWPLIPVHPGLPTYAATGADTHPGPSRSDPLTQKLERRLKMEAATPPPRNKNESHTGGDRAH